MTQAYETIATELGLLFKEGKADMIEKYMGEMLDKLDHNTPGEQVLPIAQAIKVASLEIDTDLMTATSKKELYDVLDKFNANVEEKAVNTWLIYPTNDIKRALAPEKLVAAS